MTIPAGAATPYGPFVVSQVGAPPCTGGVGQPEPATCTGAPNALADYVCWSKGSAATCGCASPMTLSAAAPSVPVAADVAPGDTLSVIACQRFPPVNTTGVFVPASTTVTFH